MFDILEDAWGAVVDSFLYLVSFDWWGDFVDVVSTAFEDIGEISLYGLVFGVACAGFVFVLRGQMLEPFLKFYSPAGKILWGGVTYVGTFIAGYVMGKYFENS